MRIFNLGNIIISTSDKDPSKKLMPAILYLVCFKCDTGLRMSYSSSYWYSIGIHCDDLTRLKLKRYCKTLLNKTVTNIF